MNKKQIAGLLAAALAFVFVFGSNALIQNTVTKEKKTSIFNPSTLNSLEDEAVLPVTPFVGVVKVEGTIQDTEISTFSTESYNHKKTLKLIDQLKNSSQNKGIVLYVNSPGGGVYESDELYNKLLDYKKETNRPVWAYMGSQACSGGYYISMAADKVYANRNTWTGSIGVIISLTNYKDLMDKLGIDSILFTSGTNKSMGNPGVDVTDEQRKIFQGLVDESYEQFVGIVAKGRNMKPEVVKPIADGRIYTAKQALDLKLIDGIEEYEAMQDAMEKQIGQSVTFFAPEENPFSLGSLFSMVQANRSMSKEELLKDFLEKEGSGVPMYYANTGK